MQEKVTKKKLKSLQKKWIDSIGDKDKEKDGALTMDFSEIQDPNKDGGKSKKKKATPTEARGRKSPREIKKEPVAGGAEESPVPEVPLGEGWVDYEMIDEIIQRAVNMEVERAIREIKAEIREQSEDSKRELFDQLKLEIETLRQEIELSKPVKGRKGLFERF